MKKSSLYVFIITLLYYIYNILCNPGTESETDRVQLRPDVKFQTILTNGAKAYNYSSIKPEGTPGWRNW